MTARERPTAVYHFTPVEHLATVLEMGLLSDVAAHAADVLTVEVGNRDIKGNRRDRPVPVGVGGSVCDYVPFYFAPQSPMMYSISRGNVPTYEGGTGRLVYLVTSLERLVELGHIPVLTDRNAALKYADYRVFDPGDPLDDGFISWDVMEAQYWTDFPAGAERRMAECLVHGRVGWESFTEVGTRNDVVADVVRKALAAVGSSIPVNVVPKWYF